MKAICIVGSPKENGSSAIIVKEIAGIFETSGIDTKIISLGAADINFCTGCKSCYQAGNCVHNDGMDEIIKDIYDSEIVVVASPSYWGDVTAQLKQFIDRCTPYCDTNPARAPMPPGKYGVAIAIRAGQNKGENENIVSTIEHFLGHLDIPLKFRFTIEGINSKEDLLQKPHEIERARTFGSEIVKAVN